MRMHFSGTSPHFGVAIGLLPEHFLGTMKPALRTPAFRLMAALAAGLGFSSLSLAQSVTTPPVGAISLTITAGTGFNRVLTPVSFPLIESKQASGLMTGKIFSVTANTITCQSAGWTAGQLSTASTPTLIQITSGPATGRTFLVSVSTANTTDTITLDPEESSIVNLTQLGLTTGTSGDTFRLLECDTLGSLFDSSITQGGTSSAVADIVQIFTGGSFAQYFYNTQNSSWRKIAFGNPVATNTPIKPDSVILYNRLAATPINLTVIGSVPNLNRAATISNLGTTVLSNSWPTATTLSGLGIQNVPGWTASASASTADIVSVFTAGSWAQYYYNGTNWRKIAFGTPISDSLVIPVASGVIVSKRTSTAGSSFVSQVIPYQL